MIGIIGFTCSFFFSVSYAQTPANHNSADIYLQLKQLKVLGTVLYIAAHPDDENNYLLPYLAKEKMYRTAYMSLTRGEGGQNLIGSEQGVELGLIRTQELLAARRMDGAEQYFSRAYEFGYSKSANEALHIWDREEVLSDIVWMIRKLQPDVIITRFPADGRAGHGHHWASAILANEAFKAAADSTKFPEQFTLLGRNARPWQVRRILWNTFNFGNTNTTANDQLRIEVGAYNPLLGESYGELGAEARSMHKSQGEGRPRRKGKIYEFFATTGGDAPRNDRNDLMDGIVTDWTRVKGGAQVQDVIDHILAGYQFTNPSASVGALVNLYKQIVQLPMPEQEVWKKKKLEEVQALIENSTGLFVEATTQQATALKGDTVKVTVLISKRNDVKATLHKFFVDYNIAADTVLQQPMETNQNYSYTTVIVPKLDPQSTQPYWLVKERSSEGMFAVSDKDLIGKAWNDPPLNVQVAVEIEGTPFFIRRPLQYKYTDPAKGELYQPFVMAPHLELYLSPDVALLNVKDETGKQRSDSMVHVIYKPNFTARNIPASLYVMQDKVHKLFEGKPTDFEKDRKTEVDVPVRQVYKSGKGRFIEAAIAIRPDKQLLTFSDFFKSITYDHIPAIHYYFKDHVKFVNEEIKVAGKKVGYIAGSGDVVPDALVQMGYEVVSVSNADITEENLKQFDAIITGVRAYNLLDYLTNKHDVLMHYVEHGGNLIVQYNRNTQVGAVKAKIGPYPFGINVGSRVTEEDAEVNFLLPQHPVLNYPNKLTAADFKDWVQERSTYQADQLDAHYQAPLGMHDTNEKESNGSLITASCGKGNFAYLSLALFRQLPAGVPGAYRLLANLIALPKNK
jgi:LmbE family N-acetylglucosaminyl deacetylase